MGTTLVKHMESLKEDFDILGIVLNGVTYQRILNHMKRYGEEYATECVKASLEKAADNADCNCKIEEIMQDEIVGGVIKQSITSPDNIVLL